MFENILVFFSGLSGIVYLLIILTVAYFFITNWWRKFIIGRSIMYRLDRYYTADYALNDPDTADIVRMILGQLNTGLVSSKMPIIEHALRHKAVLYKCSVYLPVKLDDEALYRAMITVRNMFARTYRREDIPLVYRDKSQLDMQLCTTTGQDITRLVKGTYPERSAEIIRNAGFGDDPDANGCVINVAMSIWTPITAFSYDYKQHIA